MLILTFKIGLKCSAGLRSKNLIASSLPLFIATRQSSLDEVSDLRNDSMRMSGDLTVEDGDGSALCKSIKIKMK